MFFIFCKGTEDMTLWHKVNTFRYHKIKKNITMKTIKEINTDQQTKLTNLFDSLGIIFAFSKEQFESFHICILFGELNGISSYDPETDIGISLCANSYDIGFLATAIVTFRIPTAAFNDILPVCIRG